MLEKPVLEVYAQPMPALGRTVREASELGVPVQ